jgi:hypothetical protein
VLTDAAFAGLRIWQTWFQTFSQHPRQESDGLNLVGALDRLVTETSSNASFSQYNRTYPNCYRSKRMLGDTPFDQKAYRHHASNARIRLRG